MRQILFAIVFALLAVCSAEAQKVPFSVTIVPTQSYGDGRSIEMAKGKDKPREFYVVLTNISDEPQNVWEVWNSWGYRAISFDMTTASGKRFVVSKREEGFTKNAPTTFFVAPGEHQVYAIRLDNWWETHPLLPKADETVIKVQAIYEVSSTPEATKYKVWTGRIESHSYNLTLRQ